MQELLGRYRDRHEFLLAVDEVETESGSAQPIGRCISGQRWSATTSPTKLIGRGYKIQNQRESCDRGLTEVILLPGLLT